MSNCRTTSKSCAIAIATICLCVSSASAEGTGAGKSGIKINAPVEIVWEAIHKARATDPDLAYTKVLSREGNELILEQSYKPHPILGTARCKLLHTEVPYQRIDFRLLESDRMKSLYGSWILRPTDTGGTYLELSSHVDTGLPFSKPLVDAMTHLKVRRRLNTVKRMAEGLNASGTVQ